MDIFEKCKTIESESSKYNKASHKLYNTSVDEVLEFTKNLVPEDFSHSKRISYIAALEKDKSLLTRYYGNCQVCKIHFKKSKKSSYLCTSCSKDKNILFCKKHNVISYNTSGCLTCTIEKTHKKYTELNKDNWIECQICGLRGGDLGSHITNVHNMLTDNYKNNLM